MNFTIVNPKLIIDSEVRIHAMSVRLGGDAQYGDGPGRTTPWWITAAPTTSEGSADASPTASEGLADVPPDRTSTPST